MQRVAIVEKSTTNEDGDVIKRYLFTSSVDGENAVEARTVRFEPIGVYNKMLRTKNTPEGWRTEGETIFFTMSGAWDKTGRKEIPDSLGGDALGRVFGKDLTEEQKERNKELAKWYTYLFGRFTFDNGKPNDFKGGLSVVGNLRLTGGQGVDFGKIKLTDDAFSTSQLVLQAKPNNAGGMRRYNLQFELSNVEASEDFLELEQEVFDYVNAANSRVLAAAEEAGKNAVVSAKLNKKGVAVTTAEKAVDLNDEIPF